MRARLESGNANITWLAFIGSVIVFGLLVASLAFSTAKPSPELEKTPIIVYCAAGIKPPVEAAAKEYEAAFGVPIQLQYGGSNSLLANIEITKTGDLYLPADESYIVLARGKNLIDESIPLARMHLQLAVKKGNPKNIKSLTDIVEHKLKLAQANPDAAAVGKLTREFLTKSGDWDRINAATTVFKGTVNDVANDIKIGAVDAGFVWDSIIHQYKELDPVAIPQIKGASSLISIAVLKSSKQPTGALRFARYLGARDKGLMHFEKYGYPPVEGDQWSAHPEIRLMAGAMLRPAIEETIRAFEQREGATVTCIYNGCGILVAQMRAGEHPDAYFSCDDTFMKQVSDLFLDATDVSQNQLVIIVPKGNPHSITRLKDLAKPGLRLGVGHEKQCAMGVLTQQTMNEAGVYNPVMKNVTVQSPTGDFLVNQLRTGSLDAVIAYASNIATARDQLEGIPIDIPCAIAVQPVAVGKSSQSKQITARLVDAIKQTKDTFEAKGFTWKLNALKK